LEKKLKMFKKTFFLTVAKIKKPLKGDENVRRVSV